MSLDFVWRLVGKEADMFVVYRWPVVIGCWVVAVIAGIVAAWLNGPSSGVS
jgi:lipopolysaccharide export LptBFGC system permease protein LptF